MKRGVVSLVIIALLSGSLGGCATKTQTGAGVGAATGAAVGAILGGIFGGKTGAVIGAGAGAIFGGAVGAGIGKHFEDKAERDRAQSVGALAYKPERGNIIRVGDSVVTPMPARPGDEVRVKVSYDILAPDPYQTIPISEQWVVLYEGKPLVDPIAREVQQKSQGGHSSTFKFTVNKDFLPGEYDVITTISNGQSQRQVRSSIRVDNA